MKGCKLSILSKFIGANHHYNLAINALEAKKYQKALREFDRTLQLNPRYTLAFINRGKLRQNLNRLSEATRDYEKALRLDPHDNQTRYRLAVLYQNMKRYPKSAHHFYYVLKDVKWTKKSGAITALKALDTKEYSKADRLMHRVLSALDFH